MDLKDADRHRMRLQILLMSMIETCEEDLNLN